MTPGDLVAGGALWIAIPIALLAGLLSFLSPCVLPLVPGYLGYLGGAVGADPARPARGRLLGGVLLFIAGFTAVFVVLTLLSGTIGLFLLQYRDIITRVMGILIIVMGLVFLGLFGIMQRTLKPTVKGNLGLVGAPLLGVALGLGWTPCMGPTLTAIIGLAWNVGDPGRAALLGVVYSLGLGIPFLLIAFGFGWAARSLAFLRRHIRLINIIGGVLLIVVGVAMAAGLWNDWMSRLGAVMNDVVLPL